MFTLSQGQSFKIFNFIFFNMLNQGGGMGNKKPMRGHSWDRRPRLAKGIVHTKHHAQNIN